jgi:hypothetical protein
MWGHGDLGRIISSGPRHPQGASRGGVCIKSHQQFTVMQIQRIYDMTTVRVIVEIIIPSKYVANGCGTVVL